MVGMLLSSFELLWEYWRGRYVVLGHITTRGTCVNFAHPARVWRHSRPGYVGFLWRRLTVLRNDKIERMTVRRDRAIRHVRFISLVVGAISFVASFALLVWIGVFAGFLRLRLFGVPAHDWLDTLGAVIVWGGSFSVSILSSWLCSRYAKKFISPK